MHLGARHCNHKQMGPLPMNLIDGGMEIISAAPIRGNGPPPPSRHHCNSTYRVHHKPSVCKILLWVEKSPTLTRCSAAPHDMTLYLLRVDYNCTVTYCMIYFFSTGGKVINVCRTFSISARSRSHYTVSLSVTEGIQVLNPTPRYSLLTGGPISCKIVLTKVCNSNTRL